MVAFPGAASAEKLGGKSSGELDCNGNSTIQQSIRLTLPCADIRGSNVVHNANTWGGRFYDNGAYIGHDEPDVTFLSSQPGSGNNVTWTETLGRDPAADPTDVSPGSDVSHWFELSPAPWFSMAMCDPNSYPQLGCTPQSDANAPRCSPLGPGGCPGGAYPGAGGAFMEMQFYPPGFAPAWTDGISCDNSHWCGALTIDSLECTLGFASCNGACEEPVNFAYIQRDGIPTGPPNPQNASLATFTANGHTLLMDPGDRVRVHMWDAPVPGHAGQMAFKVVVDDLTTGRSGFMQASAANGFQNTSIVDCSDTPFNFQPEYNTAAKRNITPWAALQTDISTEYETGHWEPCTKLTGKFTFDLPGVTPAVKDTSYSNCIGPYENTTAADGPNSPETTDAFCFPAGDTHGVQNTPPDTMTGCVDFLSGGDLDFDGSPYWPEWPTSATPSKFPGSFVQQLPVTAGSQYSRFFIQTDTALSESTCSGTTTSGCAVPPPTAPGNFYPYWARVAGATCTLEFGNVSSGPGVNDFGKDAQYGTDRIATLGYPEFEGPVRSNACVP